MTEELAASEALGVNATSAAAAQDPPWVGGGKAKKGDEAKDGDGDAEGAPQAFGSVGLGRQRLSQKRRRDSAAPADGIAEARTLKKGRRLADGDGGLDASAPTLRPDTAAQMIEELQKKAEVMPRPVTLP